MEAYIVCMSHVQKTGLSEQLYRALEQESHAIEQSLGYRRKLLAHRHYLEYDAAHGTPSQRQREHTQSQRIAKKQLIIEEMNTGGFTAIKGKGEPIQNEPATHVLDNLDEKLNKVLMSAGCAPDWIALDKEIREEVKKLVGECWSRYKSTLMKSSGIKIRRGLVTVLRLSTARSESLILRSPLCRCNEFPWNVTVLWKWLLERLMLYHPTQHKILYKIPLLHERGHQMVTENDQSTLSQQKYTMPTLAYKVVRWLYSVFQRFP